MIRVIRVDKAIELMRVMKVGDEVYSVIWEIRFARDNRAIGVINCSVQQ